MRPRGIVTFVLGVLAAVHAARSLAQGLPPQPPSPACRDASLGPAVAGCFVSGITPEIRALNRVACLLDALHRWKLSAIACSQQQIDHWQATVMWPVSALLPLRGALARLRTLREQVEALITSGWRLEPPVMALSAIYTSPGRVDRRTYETAWGRSRGPARDLEDLAAWLSAYNRNTIQARTSAAFGLAGELPEHTWERIGREGAKLVAEARRDPLSALRHTPQMLADRARVDASTLRLEAQGLLTEQVHRDLRRYKRRREAALGALFLDTLTSSEAVETRP